MRRRSSSPRRGARRRLPAPRRPQRQGRRSPTHALKFGGWWLPLRAGTTGAGPAAAASRPDSRVFPDSHFYPRRRRPSPQSGLVQTSSSPSAAQGSLRLLGERRLPEGRAEERLFGPCNGPGPFVTEPAMMMMRAQAARVLGEGRPRSKGPGRVAGLREWQRGPRPRARRLPPPPAALPSRVRLPECKTAGKGWGEGAGE